MFVEPWDEDPRPVVEPFSHVPSILEQHEDEDVRTGIKG